MAQRVTREMLGRVVDNLNMRFGRTDGQHYMIEYAYHRPALMLVKPTECGRTLSPRLPTGQMLEWLNAFRLGLEESQGEWQRRIKANEPLVVQLMAV